MKLRRVLDPMKKKAFVGNLRELTEGEPGAEDFVSHPKDLGDVGHMMIDKLDRRVYSKHYAAEAAKTAAEKRAEITQTLRTGDKGIARGVKHVGSVTGLSGAPEEGAAAKLNRLRKADPKAAREFRQDIRNDPMMQKKRKVRDIGPEEQLQRDRNAKAREFKDIRKKRPAVQQNTPPTPSAPAVGEAPNTNKGMVVANQNRNMAPSHTQAPAVKARQGLFNHDLPRVQKDTYMHTKFKGRQLMPKAEGPAKSLGSRFSTAMAGTRKRVVGTEVAKQFGKHFGKGMTDRFAQHAGGGAGYESDSFARKLSLLETLRYMKEVDESPQSEPNTKKRATDEVAPGTSTAVDKSAVPTEGVQKKTKAGGTYKGPKPQTSVAPKSSTRSADQALNDGNKAQDEFGKDQQLMARQDHFMNRLSAISMTNPKAKPTSSAAASGGAKPQGAKESAMWFLGNLLEARANLQEMLPAGVAMAAKGAAKKVGDVKSTRGFLLHKIKTARAADMRDMRRGTEAFRAGGRPPVAGATERARLKGLVAESLLEAKHNKTARDELKRATLLKSKANINIRQGTPVAHTFRTNNKLHAFSGNPLAMRQKILAEHKRKGFPLPQGFENASPVEVGAHFDELSDQGMLELRPRLDDSTLGYAARKVGRVGGRAVRSVKGFFSGIVDKFRSKPAKESAPPDDWCDFAVGNVMHPSECSCSECSGLMETAGSSFGAIQRADASPKVGNIQEEVRQSLPFIALRKNRKFRKVRESGVETTLSALRQHDGIRDHNNNLKPMGSRGYMGSANLFTTIATAGKDLYKADQLMKRFSDVVAIKNGMSSKWGPKIMKYYNSNLRQPLNNLGAVGDSLKKATLGIAAFFGRHKVFEAGDLSGVFHAADDAEKVFKAHSPHAHAFGSDPLGYVKKGVRNVAAHVLGPKSTIAHPVGALGALGVGGAGVYATKKLLYDPVMKKLHDLRARHDELSKSHEDFKTEFRNRHKKTPLQNA